MAVIFLMDCEMHALDEASPVNVRSAMLLRLEWQPNDVPVKIDEERCIG
jgi:hypothetical protein